MIRNNLLLSFFLSLFLVISFLGEFVALSGGILFIAAIAVVSKPFLDIKNKAFLFFLSFLSDYHILMNMLIPMQSSASTIALSYLGLSSTSSYAVWVTATFSPILFALIPPILLLCAKSALYIFLRHILKPFFVKRLAIKIT